MNNSICLIIPYFGNFPAFFDLFLASCRYNKTINWLIITDNKLYDVPSNIKVINTTFHEFRQKVQSKFDFEISLRTPYKLCDFKPAYGYILEDHLKEYDFWGHCDVDLIFGNIRKFITDEVLGKYDKILTYGHLSIYRNNQTVNRWFMNLTPIQQKYSYQSVFSNEESYAFDEYGGKEAWGGMVKMIRNAGISIYNEMDFDDIRQTQYSFFSKREIKNKPWTLKDLSTMPSFYSFQEGVLSRHIMTPEGENISESLYVHFQKRKMTVDNDLNLNEFIIVPNCFKSATTDYDIIWHLSRYKFFYLPYIIRRFNNMKRKIKRKMKKLAKSFFMQAYIV